MHTKMEILVRTRNYSYDWGKVESWAFHESIDVPTPYQHLDPPEFWEPLDRRSIEEIFTEMFKECIPPRRQWWEEPYVSSCQ